jgi:hypothetical protein
MADRVTLSAGMPKVGLSRSKARSAWPGGGWAAAARSVSWWWRSRAGVGGFPGLGQPGPVDGGLQVFQGAALVAADLGVGVVGEAGAVGVEQGVDVLRGQGAWGYGRWAGRVGRGWGPGGLG